MEARMYEAIKIKNETVRRNEYLEYVHNADQEAKKGMEGNIEKLSMKIAEFRDIAREADLMGHEDHRIWLLRMD
jgi:hypothetical protein